MRRLALLAAAALAACTSGSKGDAPDPPACVAGVACQPSAPCRTGVVACSPAGAASCVEAVAADGTECGSGLACLAGGCEPAVRTLQIGFRTVYHLRDGTQVSRPDTRDPATLSVLVDAGDQGYATYPVTEGGPASVTVAGVPRARWFLFDTLNAPGYFPLEEHAATVQDIAFHEAGRPDQVWPWLATPVALELSGLEPWQAGQSLLELNSASLYVGSPLYGTWYGSWVPDLAQGAESNAAALDWDHLPMGSQPLLDAAEGDEVWIHQVSPRTVAGGPLDGLTYRAAARALHLEGHTFADGVGGTLAGALTPGTPVAMDLDLDGATFRGHRADLGPGQEASSVRLQAYVFGQPHADQEPEPYGLMSPNLLVLDAVDAADGPASLGYARFLGDPWGEELSVAWSAAVPITAPGATSPARVLAYMDTLQAVPGSGRFSTAVRLTPVTAPTVDGADARVAEAGVSATPVLAWGPPAVGTATHHSVTVWRLGVGATGKTTRSMLFRASVSGRRLRIPPGVLQAGQTYVATIRAGHRNTRGPGGTAAVEGFLSAGADCITGPFTVRAAP